jgi:hypothetical protein
MSRLASQTGSEIGEIVLAAVLGMAVMVAVAGALILAPVWFALKPEPRKDRR